MTRRDRVIKAIQHKQTDFAPHNIELTVPARERLLAYVGDESYLDQMGNHLTGWSYGSFEETYPGSDRWRDLFGVVWNRSVDKDIGVIDGLVLPERTLAGYEFPPIDETVLREGIKGAFSDKGDKAIIAAIGFSMFERAWTLRGMENLLMDMLEAPEFVDELLDAICEHNLRIVDLALEYPFDGFYFGDDWGQQKGTIMGARHWKRFIKPRMARLYDRVKPAGKFVMQHSCGDISEILPDVIEIGLDVYQTFQPEIYDIADVKREYGRDLTFFGGISTQKTLPWVTPDEVKRIARETIRIMSVGGGYIAAPTHDVPGDVPPENIVALVEVFNEQNPEGEN